MPVHQNKPSKACGYVCHALSPELAELACSCFGETWTATTSCGSALAPRCSRDGGSEPLQHALAL